MRRPYKISKTNFKGKDMTYGRMVRMKTLWPLIRDANKKGMSIPQAAKYLGWSTSTLRIWTKILNIKWKTTRRRNGYSINKDGWDVKIKKMLSEGKNQTYIANVLGCGDWNITRYIKTNNLLNEPNKPICN
jgi:hypothetical protein